MAKRRRKSGWPKVRFKKKFPFVSLSGARGGGYKVCWWFVGREKTTCRTLSAQQHRNAREAAETVIMQNPSALVRVKSPRGGGRGVVYWRVPGSQRIARVKKSMVGVSRGFVL